MKPDESVGAEEQRAAWLAAWDDALAAGLLENLSVPDVPSELREELDRELEYLRQVRAALSGSHATDDSPSTKVWPGTDSVLGGDGLPRPGYDFLAPAQSADEMGRLGPYRVLRELGRGGMGMVFEAEDPQLRRRVALKVMRPGWSAGTAERQRFVREAQAIASLEHDHVVAIYQVGEDRGVPFLAMQLLHGETLQARLRRERKLPPAEVVRIGREIASGLAAAHAAGLVHRDIKPANVWLEDRGDERPACPPRVPRTGAPGASATGEGEPGASATGGRVKLLDFGLARPVEDDLHLTQEGAVAGTPLYMSPEQAAGEAVDHRSDLFSLGCVLYYLSTGRPPFAGRNRLAILRALAVEQPRPPADLEPAVPPALSELILHLLAQDPAGRPQTAAAVCAALADLEGDPSGRPSCLPATEKAGRKVCPTGAGRKSRATRLAAAVLLAVLGLGAWLLGPAVYRFATDQGQLVIQTEDPEVEVSVTQNGRRVRLLDGRSGREVTLKAGRYQVEVSGGREGLHLSTREFSLSRGGREVVKVWWEPPAPPAFPISAHGPVGPLDALDPIHIAVEERFSWQPAELVQVLGEHRGEHWHEVGSVAFRPDGQLAASGGADGAIHLWDAQTLRPRGVLRGHATWVNSLAFSPDGHLLLSGSEDRTLCLWDVETGKEVRRFHGHTATVTTGAAFSADGTRILSGAWTGDATVRLWDVHSGVEVMRCRGHLGGVRAVALRPDARQALSGGNDGTVRLWDLRTGEELRRFRGHTSRVTAVALSPDGRWALSGGGEGDATVRLWDVEHGKEIRRLRGHAVPPVLCVAFSPDGKLALSCGMDREVRLWDLDAGKEVRQLRGHTAQVWSVAFSPDGKRALTAGADHTVRLWDLETGRDLHPPAAHPVVRSIAFSPDGRRLLSGGQDDTLLLWDLPAGKVLRRFRGHTAPPWCVALSPDGRTALSGGGDDDATVRLWDVETALQRRCLRGHRNAVFRVAFCPGGRVLSAGADRTARLWDAEGERERYCLEHPDHVWGAAVSPDGRQLLTGCNDGNARLWDAEGGKELRRFDLQPDEVRFVAFIPGGRFALGGGYRGNLRLWDLGSREPRQRTLASGHSGWVRTVALTPDGKAAVTAGEDGRVHLWDAGAWETRRQWRLPGPVMDAAFAPDGRHLALANANGTIYLLRLAPPARE